MTKQNNKKHPHQEMIEETLKLLNLSTMRDDEKNMWTILLPSMERDELEKFKKMLMLTSWHMHLDVSNPASFQHI